jgi:multidrug resistance efflux pump
VSGKVLKVHVRNDQEVDVGQALFDVDPEPYEIAVQRCVPTESVRRSVNAAAA